MEHNTKVMKRYYLPIKICLKLVKKPLKSFIYGSLTYKWAYNIDVCKNKYTFVE